MNNKLPIRKANRLLNYDYSSAGYYFVTINVKDKLNQLGRVIEGKIMLNKIGMISDQYWKQIPDYYSNVRLDEYVIMPNHIHGILIIDGEKRTAQCAILTNSVQQRKHNQLSTVVRTYKTLVKREITKAKYALDFAWQRSFYDHVIRNGNALFKIREYTANNPKKWQLDEYYNED